MKETDPFHIQRRGVMLVLSSPSGAGKSTIARKILESDEGYAKTEVNWLIPMDIARNPFDEEDLALGEAHWAARCGASGKRCNAVQGSNIPHRRPTLPALRTSLRSSHGARTTSITAPSRRAGKDGHMSS